MTNVDTSYLLDFSFPDSFNKNSDISIHPITHSAEQSIDRKQAFYLQNWSRGLRASVKRWNQTSFGKDKGTQHWHGKTGCGRLENRGRTDWEINVYVRCLTDFCSAACAP